MAHDVVTATDGVSVGVQAPISDAGIGTTNWRVQRWDEEATRWVKTKTGLVAPTDADFMRLRVAPYSVTDLTGNLITTAGWTRLMNLLTAQGGTQALDATHTRIGVGDSSTAETYADTDLGAAAGSTHRWFQPVSGVGTLGTRTLAFSASFGTADGNFAWNEFGLDVTSGAATAGNTIGALLFNHKAGIAQGTKASGQTWTATATITFS